MRQTNAQNPNPRQRAASLVHPFSLVYIKNDGTIRYGCASIRQTLELFEKIAISQTEPTLRFCDWFDHKTAHGKKMQHYNNLLKKFANHIQQVHNAQFAAFALGGGCEFVLPKIA